MSRRPDALDAMLEHRRQIEEQAREARGEGGVMRKTTEFYGSLWEIKIEQANNAYCTLNVLAATLDEACQIALEHEAAELGKSMREHGEDESAIEVGIEELDIVSARRVCCDLIMWQEHR